MSSDTRSTRVLRGFLPILLLLTVSTRTDAQTTPIDAAPAGTPASATALPALAELQEGWNTLRPGGTTTCALGDEFSFWVRAADPERLVVYLYGGGGCWDAETCDPERSPSPYVSAVDPAMHPSRLGGIFDLEHPRNPVAGHSIVAVPYCTGDVFVGDRDATYTLTTESGGVRQFTIRHRGQENTLAAVRWIQANFPAPREIVVAGSSAGAVGTPFWASLLAQHYPAARVVGLGDDAGSYRSEAIAGADTRQWGVPDVLRRHPGWQGVAHPVGIEHLFVTAARSAPNLRLFQFDHAHDQAQRHYLELTRAADPDVFVHLQAARRVIGEQVPEFRSFTTGGSAHTVLTGDAFYYYHTDGQRLRDWVAAIVAGEAVASVDCGEQCLRPGLAYDDRDLRIVERAIALLSAPNAWNRQDAPGPCPAQTEQYSIRCAAVQAAHEVTGRRPAGQRHIPPSLRDVILTVTERAGDPGPGGPFRQFNDHPDTTLEDVLAVLEEVRGRVRTELASRR